MSGADLIHNFAENATVTRYATGYQIATLVFDADFITGNEIDLNVNGEAIATVPFNATHNQTMIDLAAAIQATPDVSLATVTGARTISITCQYAATELIIDDIFVTGGLTQAEGEITSRVGGYVDGEFQAPATSTFDIEISVQPLSGDELLQLPEADRNREYMKGYTATALQIADEKNGNRGDRIAYKGKVFEVQRSARWMITDLNHYKVYIAEVNEETN